jgi:short-chain fatty acids transporter
VINRLANAFTAMAQRWVPDAYVIAVLLTLIVFVFALFFGFAPETSLVDRLVGSVQAWNGGFWALLSFAMQMCIIMLGGYVLAQTRPVAWLLDRLAEKATTPTRAVLIVSLFSMLSALVNWGLSLAGSGVIARKVGQKCRRADFRLLVACAYLGMSATWHAGLSASAPLLMATPGKVDEMNAQYFADRAYKLELVSVSQTLFSPFNILLTALVIVVIAFLCVRLHPKEEDVVAMPTVQEEVERPERPEHRPWSEWIEESPWLTLTVVALLVTALVQLVLDKGAFAIDLNFVNMALLTLAILLHWTPQRFLGACERGGRIVWGIIVQFPFYAGIAGLIGGTMIKERVSAMFVENTSASTFPLVVYWYSGVVNYFVPSGGSKWYLEVQYIMDATQSLGVDPALTVLAYAWGDMMTDAIQPFWAIPLLGLAGLKFRDIMGFLTVVFLVYATLVSLAFLVAPRFF